MALRRAVRSAVVQPGAFALSLKVLHSPGMALFAAFGAFAMLLFVEFQGSVRDRLRSQTALVLVSAALSCLGTLCSRSTVLAVIAMGVLGIAIIFAGVVSSVLAGATTSLLLSFILAVALRAPVSAIPAHLAGWGIAGGLSLLAIVVVPAPLADGLAGPVLAAVAALAERLRGAPEDDGTRTSTECALQRLTRAFLATPYRPTGLTTAARAGIRLVDELRWLGGIIAARGHDPAAEIAGPVRAVRGAAAAALEQVAETLRRPGGGPADLRRAREALRAVARELPGEVARRRSDGAAAVVSALDPAFEAIETAFMVDQIAANVEVIAAASSRSWLARALGRQPAGFEGRLASARERAGAHLALGSASARNALRGGVALAVAVLISHLFDLQHAFWVSLGTLSILRSNALSTGQTFARALLGTVFGLLVGGAVVAVVGTDRTLLWALLPVAVLVAGIAPAAVSFTAGQAAFTLVLFIVFNIIAPAGYALGLVRIEDIGLGGATSLLVGLLFWPRGAGAAFGRALADAYARSTDYLTASVAFGVACCAPGPGATVDPASRARDAAAADRRLDDTFRTYLAERGPKRVALAGVAALVNGPTILRLSADAVLELWRGEGEASPARFAAGAQLAERARELEGWFTQLGTALDGAGAVPEASPADPGSDTRLAATIAGDLRSADRARTAAAVRIVWTGDHLDAARRLEGALVEPARERGRS